MDQAIVQRLRNDLSAVVPPQECTKEFCVVLDLSGIKAEYVAQQKVPRGVLTQRLGLEKLLSRRHSIRGRHDPVQKAHAERGTGTAPLD